MYFMPIACADAFETMPTLSNIYQGPEDSTFEMFYLDDAEVSFWSFGDHASKPESHRL